MRAVFDAAGRDLYGQLTVPRSRNATTFIRTRSRHGRPAARTRARRGGVAERKATIDRVRRLSIARQAEALGIIRGRMDYLPRPVSDDAPKVMWYRRAASGVSVRRCPNGARSVAPAWRGKFATKRREVNSASPSDGGFDTIAVRAIGAE
jgi:hypothetical protein